MDEFIDWKSKWNNSFVLTSNATITFPSAKAIRRLVKWAKTAGDKEKQPYKSGESVAHKTLLKLLK